LADKAHILTDKKLEEMEKRLSAIYSEAEKDLQKKADEFFDKFKKADEINRKKVKNGEMTEDEYKEWRKKKVMRGKQYTDMKRQVSENLLHTNEIAIAYINGQIPEVYALGYNALAPTVDGVGGYSFSLVDADTVRNLATTDKSLLPYKKLNPAKDVAWNMKKVNSQVLQGVIQGESIPKIAKRIKNVQEMNRASAIRTARTIVTGAENKGRMDSYKRAEADGIILEKKWIATDDNRTRDWHGELDGKTAPTDVPFSNSIGLIMFPGDSGAHPANVYNCRCSMRAVVKGFKKVKK
jgi:SPP1 gp7 family putative phage head morphogenesis protein